METASLLYLGLAVTTWMVF